MSGVPEFNTKILNDYLRMVEDTESPRLFHVWCVIGAIAAALGRRNWLPFGDGKIYPNQYITLVGTPGTRKSTCLRIAKARLKQSTGVRYAPDDTSGQRQGLIKAMMRNSNHPDLYLNGHNLNKRDDSLSAITELHDIAAITDEAPDEATLEVDSADKQHLLATSDEFSRFIGQNSLGMLDFLTSAWDGRSYTYETTTKEITIEKPLLNIIGCTTPVSIANSMPPAAGGQGFLSRVILVYGSKKYREVPRPRPFPTEAVDSVQDRLSQIYLGMSGEFEETADAVVYTQSIYGQPLDISDSRFSYYRERRQDHLLKLAMCLAAGRGSHTIVKDDYVEANRILRATERGMPDALGEFGMNPLAALKQSILEFMRHSLTMPVEELRAHFHRDSRAHEFQEVINDLIRTKQLTLTTTTSGRSFLNARVNKTDTEDTMMKLLAQT